MRNILVWVGLSWVFFNCKPAQNTSRSNASNEVAGRYEGTLPCPDCDGIRYTLTLNQDGSYREESFSMGKSQQTETKTGNWKLDINTIMLTGKDIFNRFAVENQQIRLLNQVGKAVTGPQANRYILYKRGETGRPQGYDNMNALLASKTFEGIDFFAVGSDPAWSLDIDAGKIMAFRATGGITINTPAPPAEPTKGGQRYLAQTGAGSLEVRILEKACTENVSGVMFSRQVEVVANGKTYRGCGQPLTSR